MCLVRMNQKHVQLLHRNFSQIAVLCSEATFPNIPITATPFGFNPITKEELVCKLVSILKATSTTRPVYKQAQQVHAQTILNGHNDTILLGSKILGVYILSARFKEARNLFYKLNLCLASPWTWMIRGLTMIGQSDLAMLIYFKMLAFGTRPDKYTFPNVIKACGGLKSIRLGKFLHRTICLMGYEMDVFVCSSLIKFYADNGRIMDAHRLFDKMPEKDVVLWNVIFHGYVNCGNWGTVIELFQEMRKTETSPDSVTYTCVLSVCASEVIIRLGTQLHGLVIKCGLEMDSSVANTLLAMYAKCHCLSEACTLFHLVPKRDTVTWNAIIGGYVQNGLMTEASNLVAMMMNAGVKPDSFTFSSFLPAVSESSNLRQGREIHGYITRNNVPLDMFLRSALIDLYSKCRKVEMAANLFNSNEIDIVICSAMISGYVLNGMGFEALRLFRWLHHVPIKPNAVTLASILPACAGLAALTLGKELHAYVLRNGAEGVGYVGSAITDMYAKCGRLDLAQRAFARLSEKDTIAWNSIITSCTQNGEPEQAVELFRRMGLEGAKYDCVSIAAALSACANLPALHYAKEIHGFMVRGGVIHDIFSTSALIDLYAKCGNLNLSRRVFDAMIKKNEVTWNSIISAYGNHGQLDDSIDLLEKMIGQGFEPDHVTFLSVLSACAHVGRIDEGKYYFKCMTEKYEITALMEHYGCMVDLYARSGRLNEAFDVIRAMPYEPDAGIWGSVLGACRLHGNVELAKVAAKHLFELDPQNSSYYVLLSNLQVDAGELGGALNTRSAMRSRRVQKVPGCSWIESNSSTHMFVSADTSHPQAGEIYPVLNNLLLELREEGYVPQLHPPLFLPRCDTSPEETCGTF